MQTTFALLALAAVAYAAPQGVTADITPTAAAPSGCATSYSGQFQITQQNFTSTKKRSVEKRACGQSGQLTASLANGQLTDTEGRTGYIAANQQFQFDKPPQTGAIYTGGFSVCSNGSLALGGSAVFWACPSGGTGGYYDLYGASSGAQCFESLIEILPCSGDAPSSGSSGSASQAADGQPMQQLTDGQPEAPTACPAGQTVDGQVQACTSTAAPVSESSEGQVYAPTSTAKPVSESSEGQVYAPTGCPAGQTVDGQVQACTSTAAPVSESSEGQVYAPTSTAKPVSESSEGQITQPTATSNTTAPKPSPFTGSASGLSIGSQFAALMLAVAAVALL